MFWPLFRGALQRVVPELADDDIERHFIFRERLVQPIPVLRYSDIVPPLQTNLGRLLVANTTQIVNSTLNNNEMVKIARKAAAWIAQTAAAERAKSHTTELAPIAPAPVTSGPVLVQSRSKESKKA